MSVCEPVWPSGKALSWKAEGPRFESASALLCLQKLWSVDTVLALIAAHLNARVILVDVKHHVYLLTSSCDFVPHN